MKDSRIEDRRLMEIGKIPKGWEVVKIEDIISLEYGKGLTAKQREIGEFPVFGSNGIIGYHSQYLIEAPGMIVGRKGTIGAITWSEKNFWPIDTTYYVELKKPNTHLKWLFYKLGSIPLARLNMATGTPGLNRNLVYSLQISLPPLPEQRRIAEILMTADTAIQKVGDAIAKTERLKKGLMQELLTKGIGHEEFKDTEIGRIPREWRVTTLRSECAVGTGGTPSRKHPEYFGGTVPWIKTTEVNYNTIMETGECITELGLQNSNAKIYPAGTLIIAMYGQGVTRGKCAILGMDAAMNQACAAVTPKNDNTTHVKYLQYWCQFKYDQIRNLGQGANQSNLNLSVVGSMRFPLPPISEQHRIAEIIRTVDKKLELERKRKEKLERIKKGLMDDLLTGKKRVTIAR